MVIETTGLASPAPIIQASFQESESAAELALQLLKLHPAVRASGNLGPTLLSQTWRQCYRLATPYPISPADVLPGPGHGGQHLAGQHGPAGGRNILLRP